MEFNATFLVSVISFIVFTLIMNSIFYKPITSIIGERQKFIDDAYSDAEKSNSEARELIDSKEKRMNEVSKESKDLMVAKISSAKQVSSDKIKQAKIVSHEKIENVKQSLIDEKNQMEDDVKTVIVSLAESISSKILGEEVSIKDESLISRVIK